MTRSDADPVVRIVRLRFAGDHASSFLGVFNAVAPRIRAYGGCLRLELWRSTVDASVFMTYSVWANADALAAYRASLLFRDTWRRIRPWFLEPARATSYHRPVSRSSRSAV